MFHPDSSIEPLGSQSHLIVLPYTRRRNTRTPKNTDPSSWRLEDFMKRVENMGEPPDFLGLHYYGPDGTAAIQYIEEM